MADHPELSIIEEIMPTGTFEKQHYHEQAFQLFYILKGTATFEFDDQEFTVHSLQGIQIPPGKVHKISNKSNEKLHFLVVSQPATKNDRINLEK